MIDTETCPMQVASVRCQSETLADTTNEQTVFNSPRSVGGYREDRDLVSKDFHNWTGFFSPLTNSARWPGHIQTQPVLNSMSGPMDGPEGYNARRLGLELPTVRRESRKRGNRVWPGVRARAIPLGGACLQKLRELRETRKVPFLFRSLGCSPCCTQGCHRKWTHTWLRSGSLSPSCFSFLREVGGRFPAEDLAAFTIRVALLVPPSYRTET